MRRMILYFAWFGLCLLGTPSVGQIDRQCQKCGAEVCCNVYSSIFMECYYCCYCDDDRYEPAEIVVDVKSVPHDLLRDQYGIPTVTYHFVVRRGKDTFDIQHDEDQPRDGTKPETWHSEWKRGVLVDICIKDQRQGFFRLRKGAPISASF